MKKLIIVLITLTSLSAFASSSGPAIKSVNFRPLSRDVTIVMGNNSYLAIEMDGVHNADEIGANILNKAEDSAGCEVIAIDNRENMAVVFVSYDAEDDNNTGSSCTLRLSFKGSSKEVILSNQ